MASFLDNCDFNATGTGTGSFVVATAVTGRQTPASAGAVSGATYRYYARSADLSQWEQGYGVYTSGSVTLTRVIILFNSAGTTAAINFTSVPLVAIVALSSDVSPIIDGLAYNAIQINGSMDVSQENGTTQITISSATDKYILDQWECGYTHAAGTAVFKGQQVAPPGSPAFGAGFSNCLQLTATTLSAMAGAGDYAYIQQKIEGYRWAKLGFGSATNPQYVTIGFWVYATITGTATVTIRNSAKNRSYISTFTVNAATTWEYKTVTVLADTSGTWLATNGIGAYLNFCFGAGSGFQGTAGVWAATANFGTAASTNFFASNNNTVCITGVTVLPGTEAPTLARSPLIRRPRDVEFPLCQRYYMTFPWVVLAGGVQGSHSLPVAMRTTPTVTGGGAGFAISQFTDGQFGSFSQNTRALQTLICDARL